MENKKLYLAGHELSVLNRYYIWLLNQIDFDSHSNYSNLLEYLHNKNYIWENPMDENRAEDGLRLRTIFEDETDYDDYSALVRPCSVLEMLIAFAIRINVDVMDEAYSTAHWFWLMLENLGIFDGKMGCLDCTDGQFDAEIVEKLLNGWLKHDENLTKSIFKSGKNYQKSGKNGQDEWSLMQTWISEHYGN